MEERDLRDLETIFAQVEDPRIERTKRHRLRDIIIIAVCGVICGADGWVGIEEFGKAKEAWFTELLQLANGIPSHDTFERVFAHIDPNQFEASFHHWVQGISTTIQGVIAIDGKTSRRTHDHATGKKALQRVECVGCREPPGVGSVGAPREKSNEITAIALLLQQLARACCIVTIDAMGTQTKIAQQSIEQEGDYAQALKDNQGNLYDEVQATFTMAEQEVCATVACESHRTVLQSAWAFGNQRVLDHQ